jgi:hypothetical protein
MLSWNNGKKPWHRTKTPAAFQGGGVIAEEGNSRFQGQANEKVTRARGDSSSPALLGMRPVICVVPNAARPAAGHWRGRSDQAGVCDLGNFRKRFRRLAGMNMDSGSNPE